MTYDETGFEALVFTAEGQCMVERMALGCCAVAYARLPVHVLTHVRPSACCLGDMRNAINNLQATAAGFGHVTAKNVFKVGFVRG